MRQATGRSSMRFRVGRGLLYFTSFVLAASGAAKLAGIPKVAAQMAAIGFSGGKLTRIAFLELASAVLWAYPRSRPLGLLMVSAYLGGAICAHVTPRSAFLPAGHRSFPGLAGRVASLPGIAPRLKAVTVNRWLSVCHTAKSNRNEGTMTVSSSSTARHTKKRGIRALAPWLSRLVLILPMLILIRIGVRYITNPSHAASATGVALSTPEALTDTRVAGALALTVAFAIAASLVSRRSFRAGHAIVIALMAFIVAVRLFGFAEDGTTLAMGDQRVKMTGEILFLVLNTVALSIQTYLAKSAGAEG